MPWLAGEDLVQRGAELSSDEYDSPPPWANTYDPGLGWTSAGVGVRVHDAVHAGDKVRLSVTVTSRPAACDRADPSAGDDMNGTADKATSWVTAHYTVLSLRAGVVTHGDARYFISYPDFREDGVQMEDAQQDQRLVALGGKATLPVGVVGLQGFDFLSNDPDHKAADCTIKAAPECVGPGRYIRTIMARSSTWSYAPDTGKAEADLRLRFSNGAKDGMKQLESGNMCVEAQGTVALLQLARGEAGPTRTYESPELSNAQVFEAELPNTSE